MSRALLLRRLVPFSPTAAGSSSYTSRHISAPSLYASAAQADAAAAGQAGAAAGAAQAGAAAAGAGEQGASAPPPEARGRWGLLKFGALAAVSAALGGVGYVSYGEDPAAPPSRSRPQGGSFCLDSSVWGFCSSDFFLLFCSASSVFA
jgi:mitochondrial import inner membrane translocase subunit TIM50